MRPDQLGLTEYLLVIGAVLGLAVWELVALVRIQRRDRRMRNGSNERTQGD
jgi:hypothetical protein